MAPVRPIPDSILKRTKDRSVPVRPSGLPHVSKTEHLLRTLKEARFFKEILENVLEDLMNFEWKSPKSGSLCVASALKMLSGTQGLYMKCFYEQRLLMERLRTKLESRGTAGGILSFLAEEAHGKESALSNELQNDSNLQVCCLNNQKGDREGWPESRLAPVMSDGIPTDRKDHDKMMQELTLFIRNEHKTATSEIHGQVKAMNILVASMKEDFERDQKVYLASKRTLSAQQKNLSLALNKTRAEAELRLEKQLKRAQDIIQDFSVKSSELLSAKADLRSLEAEVRDLKWSIEDSGFSRAVPDECDSKYVLDQIGSLSKFLKDARVPEHQFRQVCSEIDALCYSVALASTPDVSKRYDNESIQTVLTGARFAEAIKAHAEKLFKNSKSKKRKDVNVIAAGESSTPRKSGSK